MSISTKFCILELVWVLKRKILIFWTKLLKNRNSDKSRTIEHIHWILLIWVSPGTKYQNKLTILIFWTKFTQKSYFRSKSKKVSINIESCKFGLVYVRTFVLNWQFWFVRRNMPKKRVFRDYNRKSEHHHSVLPIWIRQGTRFQLKLSIFNFGTKFSQKRVFPVENGKGKLTI